MVVLRFFRSSGKRIKPDGTILGKLEKNLLLKKTQWNPSFRIKWSHKGNFSEITTKPDGTILVDASELANYVQIAAVTPTSLIGSLNSLPNAQRRLLAT